jgi:hypothetical protein
MVIFSFTSISQGYNYTGIFAFTTIFTALVSIVLPIPITIFAVELEVVGAIMRKSNLAD